MKIKYVRVHDALYLKKEFGFSDLVRLENNSIYQMLDDAFPNFEIKDYKAFPIHFEDEYVEYKIIPTEYISNVFEDNPVEIRVCFKKDLILNNNHHAKFICVDGWHRETFKIIDTNIKCVLIDNKLYSLTQDEEPNCPLKDEYQILKGV